MTKFVDDVTVVRKLTAIKLTADQALARASGAPGAIFNFKHAGEANANAADILKAALMHGGPQGHAERLKVAARQGAAGARGKFTDMLDALTALLHQRARVLALAGDGRAARRTAHAIVHVEFVKEKAAGNVSPNLLTASLVTTLHELLTQ
jgi:DNA polymerase-3 subunit delta'